MLLLFSIKKESVLSHGAEEPGKVENEERYWACEALGNYIALFCGIMAASFLSVSSRHFWLFPYLGITCCL